MIHSRLFVTLGLILVATSIHAAPSLSVALIRGPNDPGPADPVLLDANGDFQYEVTVFPDHALATGGNGVVETELAFILTGTGLAGAAVQVPADWNQNHSSTVPADFGSGFDWLALNGQNEAEGLQFDAAVDEVFAGLQSVNFPNGNFRRLLRIKATGPSLPMGNPQIARSTAIQWGGAYDGAGRLIQGGNNTAVSGMSGTYIAVPGDANLNGAVDLSDFKHVINNFNMVAHWGSGNFNNPKGGPVGTNAITGLEDFNLIINNFGSTSIGGGGLAAIPEPTSGLLALGFVGAVGLLRRRAKRNALDLRST